MRIVPRVARIGRRLAHLGGRSPAPRIWYVAPPSNWTHDWVANYIAAAVRGAGLDASVAPDVAWAEGDIVHFGSTWAMLDLISGLPAGRNGIVATIFHGDRDPKFPELRAAMDKVLAKVDRLDYLVTACTLMQRRFVSWGVDPAKIRVIPLGIDLANFRPADPDTRLQFRRRLGIPDDAVCIGSFQKDGDGWGEGLEPKMIKGPDIFVEAVSRLKRQFPNVFVLLTGPARGYVKRELDRRGIPFRHDMLDQYLDVVGHYQICDLYLVTSREEGGPMSVLESMATGAPLISTRVGLAPDIVEDGVNGFLVDIEDIDAMVDRAGLVLSDNGRRDAIVAAALRAAESYSWDAIGGRLIDTVYRPLLQRLM